MLLRASLAASPAARHPTSGTTRETHRASPRTPLATGPARSGTHAMCGAPRRHTMPSAQAAGKRGIGAGRTSVSQSLGPTGHSVRCAFAEGVAKVGTIGEFSRKMARPAGFEPATPGLEGRAFRSGGTTRYKAVQRVVFWVVFRSFSGRSRGRSRGRTGRRCCMNRGSSSTCPCGRLKAWVHSRLHVEIMHLLSPRWPGGRSWLTEGAGSVHQRRRFVQQRPPEEPR